MGAAQGRELEEPRLEKSSGEGFIEHSQACLRYGYSSCQGWRKDMEDAHACVESIKGLPDCSFFGVFDGHGGDGAAHYVARGLLPKILEHLQMGSEGRHSAAELHQQLAYTVPNAFVALDEYMAEHPHEYRTEKARDPGSTAVTAIITPSHLVVAHVGDARAVLCRDGVPIFVTKDHKPELPHETHRIVSAGGFVSARRVCRSLAVSRAFGDHHFKARDRPPTLRMVTSVPDIAVLPRHPQDEFLVLACDGIWDVMTAEQLCVFISEKLLNLESISSVCDALIDYCMRRGSTDNMTVILICFSAARRKIIPQDMVESWFCDGSLIALSSASPVRRDPPRSGRAAPGEALAGEILFLEGAGRI